MNSDAESTYREMCEYIATLANKIGLSRIPKIIQTIDCEDQNIKLIEKDKNSQNNRYNNEIYLYLAFTDFSANKYPLIYTNLHGIITIGRYLEAEYFTGKDLNERITCLNTVNQIACQLVSPPKDYILKKNKNEYLVSNSLYPIYVLTYQNYLKIQDAIYEFTQKYMQYSISFKIKNKLAESCLSDFNTMQNFNLMSFDMFILIHLFGCICIYRDFPEDSIYDIVQLKEVIFSIVPFNISTNWNVIYPIGESPAETSNEANPKGSIKKLSANPVSSQDIINNHYNPFFDSTKKSLQQLDNSNQNKRTRSPSARRGSADANGIPPFGRETSPYSGRRAIKPVQIVNPSNRDKSQQFDSLKYQGVKTYKTLNENAMIIAAIEPYELYKHFYKNTDKLHYTKYNIIINEFNTKFSSPSDCLYRNISDNKISLNSTDLSSKILRFKASISEINKEEINNMNKEYLKSYGLIDIPIETRIYYFFAKNNVNIQNLYYMFLIILYNVNKNCVPCTSKGCEEFINSDITNLNILIEKSKLVFDKEKSEIENEQELIKMLVGVPPIYLVDISSQFN